MTEIQRDRSTGASRREALGVGALGISTLVLPSASAAASGWTTSTVASASFEGENWVFYRSGGTAASTGTTTFQETPILRLTNTSEGVTGAVLNTKQFAVGTGLDIRFTMAQWGSASGADGLCFFLVDAAATVTTPGAAGGGLAYTGSGWNDSTSTFDTGQGIAGGLFGIGFDNFGNFGTAGGGPVATGETVTSADGNNARPWLTIRGGASSYPLLSTVDRGASAPKDYWAAALFADGSTRCRVTVTADGELTVYAGEQGDVATDFTALAQRDQITITGLFTGVSNVRFGFSAATGGQVNNHAVYENVTVSALT